MFSAIALPLSPGESIFVAFGDPVIFHPDAMIVLPSVPGSTAPAAGSIVWDFGDGTRAGPGSMADEQLHTYGSPGRYLLTAQVTMDRWIDTFSWVVLVGVDRLSFPTTHKFGTMAPYYPAIPVLGALHAGVQLSDGAVRHMVMPLPPQSAPDGASDLGDWGGSSASAPSSELFAQALDKAAAHFQRSWATSFGRLPMPGGAGKIGLWMHVPAESLPGMTSTRVQAGLFQACLLLKEMYASGDEQRALGFAMVIKELEDDVFAQGTVLRPIYPPTIAAPGFIVPGPDSIRVPEVAAWLAARSRAVADDAVASDLQVAELRRLAGQCATNPPTVDVASVWRWYAAQAAMQALDAFYSAAAARGCVVHAMPMLTVNSATGFATLRWYDLQWGMWAMLSVAPAVAPASRIAPADQAFESGARQAGAGYAAARAVGVLHTLPEGSEDPGDLAALFQPTAIAAALEGCAARRSPAVMTSTTRGTSAETALGYMTLGYIGATGAAARGLDSTEVDGRHVVAVQVERPALPLPSVDDCPTNLCPHAVLFSELAKRGR